MKKAIAIVIGIIFYNISNCQTNLGSINGQIIYSKSDLGVKTATIFLSNLSDSTNLYEILCDSNGLFTINKLPFSLYKITVKKEGYFEYTNEIEIDKDTLNLKISLPKMIIDYSYPSDFSNINFEYKKSSINFDKNENVINYLYKLLSDNINLNIKLIGHSDTLECAKMDTMLSFKRAEAVKIYLISKSISKERIITQANGGYNPIIPYNEPDMNLNRRVEISLIMKRK